MATAPYPNLSDICDQARLNANDLIVSNGGQTLTNTAAFTPLYVNRGWQALQQYLLELGYRRFIVPNSVILSLPPAANEDTSLQVTLSWTGYNDGVTNYPAIVLPQSLIKPTKLAERVSGASPNIGVFYDMDGPEQGITRIPSIQKGTRNSLWVFDGDQISMPGSLTTTDLRVDFESFLPDFATSPFPGTQTANIMRCTNALAWFVVYFFSEVRGDIDAATALSNARDEAAIIAGKPLPSEAQAA